MLLSRVNLLFINQSWLIQGYFSFKKGQRMTIDCSMFITVTFANQNVVNFNKLSKNIQVTLIFSLQG